MDKKFAISNHVCECCGREFDDIENDVCPSDDCPSNMEAAEQYVQLTEGGQAVFQVESVAAFGN